MTDPRVRFLDEWERMTVRDARRSRVILRAVLVAAGIAWLINVTAAFVNGMWWSWAAVVYLPVLVVINLRSTSRLRHQLDASLLRISAERVAMERRDE